MTRILLVAAWCAALGSAQIFKLSPEQLIEITRKNPYGRFADGRPNVPNDVLEKVRGLSVEEAWSPLRGNADYPNQYEGGWRIMHPGQKLVGRVVTAQFMPKRADLNDLLVAELKAKFNHTSSPHQWVLDQLREGDVLVVDMFGKEEGGSVVGDNLAAFIQNATKTGGLIVDGAIRDVEGIHPLGMQIYYRHATPSAIDNVQLTGYNIPVRIGKATVLPGDVVLGDRTGVYFLPPNLLKSIVDRAEETHIHDEWTKAKFATGKYKSSELYPTPKDPAMKKEYEEYKAKKMGKQ
ncbi:MAG: dimethylmenaquinone methyltransferase [Bryobacterales bacterium]|nr:dimethylmenaquinone methyltransferase [Bryobacterales bacterium]